ARLTHRPHRPALFPYTTLFRSEDRNQDELIEKVAAANPNTVVVMETGGPVLTPWRDKVRGLLEAWYPGVEGGTAIARVLFGDVRSEEHTSELQSPDHLVCRLLL